MYILVVDDDHFANTLVQFVLTKEGYEVETADNPRGAMQMIQRREGVRTEGHDCDLNDPH